jgi:predicted alpha/beta superfamily hydrolase
MGSLMSQYMAFSLPHLFSRVGIFSPAFWFAKEDILNFVKSKIREWKTSGAFELLVPEKIYIDVGTQEGSRHFNDEERLTYIAGPAGQK